MLRALRNIIGPVILMAALGGCGDMNTASFLNDSARPTSTKIQFRNGISYAAPRGFCVHDQETYQDETKGFGVFATCSGAYNRSRLLTVAHYPTDPDHKVELENLVQAAGLGAKVLKVVEKDGAIYARLHGDLTDQDLQPKFNRMIVQKKGYVIMANLYARERANNADFTSRQILAQVLNGIIIKHSEMPQLVRYLPTDPRIRPRLRP